MINIALLGYGRMGQLLDQLIESEENMDIVQIVDPNYRVTESTINKETMKNVDVCIDFSEPKVVLQNIRKASELGINIVIGTSGWFDRIEEVKKFSKKNNTGIIWGANFSLGMNAFFKIIEDSSKLMNLIKNYDPFGLELHHSNKLDSPSGTAEELAGLVKENIERKTEIVYDRVNRKIKPEEFHFASIRTGNVPGTHKIGFDSEADTIELTHTARNRNGFAMGAIQAAKWIYKKKGFYNFRNVFLKVIGEF